MRSRLLLAATALLLAACSGTGQAPDSSPTATASPTMTSDGNGTVFLTSTEGETATVTAYAIAADGTLGPPRTVATGTATDTLYFTALDGLGDLSLTGEFDTYWTTSATLRRGGDVLAAVPAKDWCGGEGLTYAICALLDENRVAHTTPLGYVAESGEGSPDGSVIVRSLTDGASLAEFGPYPGLALIFGTRSADEVVLVTGGAVDEQVPSTVARLDLTDGSTTPIGTSPTGWAAVCPLSDDAVLGVSSTENAEVTVVGPASVAPITLGGDEYPEGCSVDGRYLYVQRPDTLVRIALADGQRTDVLDVGTSGVLITR